MSEKTVIYVGGFEMPDKNAAAHRVLNNARILRQLGYRVLFLGVTHGAQKAGETVTYDGFSCLAVPYPRGLRQWVRYLTDSRELQAIIGREKPTAVFFYNYQSVALAKAMRYCKKQGIRTVADVTEWYLAEGNVMFRIIKQLDTSYRMRILHKRADSLMVISRYLETYYTQAGCQNVVRIPPLVDLTEPKWSGDVSRVRDGRIHLIYAGVTTDLKDRVTTVIAAVYPFRDRLTLTMVGMEREQLTAFLQKKGKLSLLGDHIEAVGYLSHADCLARIKASDFQIFIRPDNLVTRAGFPTKLGESFACGTPVITNPSSNVADYMRDGENGFLVANADEASLTAVLARVAALTDSDVCRMKEACRRVNDFDYRFYTEKMRELL